MPRMRRYLVEMIGMVAVGTSRRLMVVGPATARRTWQLVLPAADNRVGKYPRVAMRSTWTNTSNGIHFRGCSSVELRGLGSGGSG